jgi:hypothetical protein
LKHLKQFNAVATAFFMALLATACAKPFDMSGERLAPLGPEWGVVIGSVLVKPVKEDTGRSRDGSDMTYQFDIVQSQPGDPEGETPYAERYRLESKASEERVFISRLRTGRYLIRSFAQDRVAGKGGDLGLVFDSMAGEVRYIGRLLIEVPQRVSRGKEYRFAVENARDETLKKVAAQHAELAKQVVDVPMRSLEEPVR